MNEQMKNLNGDFKPEDARVANLLERTAHQIELNPDFQSALEGRLKDAYGTKGTAAMSLKKIMPAIIGAIALIVLAIVLDWAFRSLAPKTIPGAGGTSTPASPFMTSESSTSTPIVTNATVYQWHGTSLTLSVPLPVSPADANVYLYQPEQPATLESSRTLAGQLGLNGSAYGTTDFIIVDGNQRLIVHPDQSFEFYPDYPRYVAAINGGAPPPDAETQINQFLAAHGFNFPHEIRASEMYNSYFVVPLTPDGHPICYEFFKCAGLNFTLDIKGILSVDGSLPKYEKVGQYGIMSAEEALQKILEPTGMSNATTAGGMLEGMRSASGPIQTWVRPIPTDQTITIYGWLSSVPSRDGSAPLITLDGYTVTGNVSNIPVELSNAFIEATGQIHDQNGALNFELQSWKSRDGAQDGLLGAISKRADGQIVLTTLDNETLLLSDVPDHLPLPLENAFVIGVRNGETFDWTSIDLRQTRGGGGGGGGGGLGFYKLNLTGTPVPFPTPQPTSQLGGAGGGGGNGEQTYTIKAGDTLSKIASEFGVSVDELAQANGISDPGTIYIGQTLVIPGAALPTLQKVEGLRGILYMTIYKNSGGGQRIEYFLQLTTPPYDRPLLQGANLEVLQAFQNRPVDIWGTMEIQNGQPVLNVDRYEIPFPDLQFQILRGTQKSVTLDGKPATLFTTSDGKTYVQLSPSGSVVDNSTIGKAGDEVLLEALAVPNENFGGYPALRVFKGAVAINPKNGQPMEMQITDDKPYVTQELAGSPNTQQSAEPPNAQQPTATIERVELIYYMPNPRNTTGELSLDQRYIQPAWLFTGHYSDGTEFFILVQALKTEFLLPESAPYTPPG
ncbi:MAG: LysM domain-containing protein [Chloroflexi bacterium]|nr:LysM domain-containing protein [Chloroflexota bacterium]